MHADVLKLVLFCISMGKILQQAVMGQKSNLPSAFGVRGLCVHVDLLNRRSFIVFKDEFIYFRNCSAHFSTTSVI